MEAKELMIGNLVTGISNTPEVITCIDYETVNTDNHDILLYNQINPIPLTEEWLIKFGFEKKPMYGRHNKYFFIKNKLYYCEHDFYSFVYSNNSLEIKEPKYVHQLQNLYYSLTGEELQEKEFTFPTDLDKLK